MLTKVGGLAEEHGGSFVGLQALRVCVCVCRRNRPSSIPPGCLSVNVLMCVCVPACLCVCLNGCFVPQSVPPLCQISDDFPVMLFSMLLLLSINLSSTPGPPNVYLAFFYKF